MNFIERITTNPNICYGKPCIRGLRYPVEMILELLSSGMTVEDILADYEDLKREDILAALSFAARLNNSTTTFRHGWSVLKCRWRQSYE